MKPNKTIVTRPRLATRMIVRGIPFEKVVNPWYPDKTAWLVEVNSQSRQVAKDFYDEIGKPLPKAFQKVEQGADNDN